MHVISVLRRYTGIQISILLMCHFLSALTHAQLDMNHTVLLSGGLTASSAVSNSYIGVLQIQCVCTLFHCTGHIYISPDIACTVCLPHAEPAQYTLAT